MGSAKKNSTTTSGEKKMTKLSVPKKTLTKNNSKQGRKIGSKKTQQSQEASGIIVARFSEN